MERTERITEMENILRAAKTAVVELEGALAGYEALIADIERLDAYYGSLEWRSDFEADEAGLLPDGLKRGVLSEDEAHDLLCANRDVLDRMRRIVLPKKEAKKAKRTV